MLMSKAAVDYCDDASHQRLHKLSRLMTMPDFVESAPVIAQEDVANLPVAVFADPANRKFPLHTKAATWLAQAYFSHDRHLYPNQQAAVVQDKIDKAAAYWGIGGFTKQARSDVETFQSRVAPELTDADFALIIERDGQRDPMLPIHNEDNIKASAATLYNMRSKCPYEWRVTAARRILKKAGDLGVQFDDGLGEYIVKAAGVGSSFPSVAADQLAHRALMIPDSQKEVKVAAAKLAKAVSMMPGLPKAAKLVKIAAIVDRMDREQGFNKYYDQGVPAPEEFLFDLTHEKAAAIRDSYLALTTGVYVPFEALQTAPLAKIAKVASTLPRDDALMLQRMLRAADIKFEDPTVDDVV